MRPPNKVFAVSNEFLRTEERWLSLVYSASSALLLRKAAGLTLDRRGITYARQANALDPWRSESHSILAAYYADPAVGKFKKAASSLAAAAALDSPRRFLEHKPYLYQCSNKILFITTMATWYLGG